MGSSLPSLSSLLIFGFTFRGFGVWIAGLRSCLIPMTFAFINVVVVIPILRAIHLAWSVSFTSHISPLVATHASWLHLDRKLRLLSNPQR
jgi:hypothetical protein